MKTKIVCTLGPACSDPAIIEQLILAGARILRLNFSHGDASQFVGIVRTIREVEERLGIPIAVLQDLSGPKIRIGNLDVPAIPFLHGDRCLFGPSSIPREEGEKLPFIPFDREEILDSIEIGDTLILADGTLTFSVVGKAGGFFVIEAKNAGIVTSRKGVALPGKKVKVPALTEKDKVDLREGLALGVDAVALSFVQSPEDVLDARAVMQKAGRVVPICAKLERQNAVDRLDDILAVADIIMVARGDLGVECPLAHLPAMQKLIIRRCNQMHKPVIVATQMLLSMVNNPIPTRAETTDVANAVLDGADCVMLSEETAMGNFPVETVRYMERITEEAEKLLASGQHGYIPDRSNDNNISQYLSYCACYLAEAQKARAIVAHSRSGLSGRALSEQRPSVPVYILTPNAASLRPLNFSWGINPRLTRMSEGSDLDRVEAFIEESGEFEKGDLIIITAEQMKNNAPCPISPNILKVYQK